MDLSAPQDLSNLSKSFYRRLGRQLSKQGIIEEIDTHLLELTARTWQMYMEAYEKVQKENMTYDTTSSVGETIYKIHPAYKILHDCLIQLRGLYNDLGMTPKSRKQFEEIISNTIANNTAVEKWADKGFELKKGGSNGEEKRDNNSGHIEIEGYRITEGNDGGTDPETTSS